MGSRERKIKERRLDRFLVLAALIMMTVMGWKSFQAMEYAIHAQDLVNEADKAIKDCIKEPKDKEDDTLILPPGSFIIEKPKPKVRAI